MVPTRLPPPPPLLHRLLQHLLRADSIPGGLSISDLVLLSHSSNGGGFGSFGGLDGMISLPHHHHQHQQEQLTQSSLENVRQAAAAAAANASLYRNLLPQSGGSLVPDLSAIHGSPSPSTPPSMRNHHSILSGLPSVSTCTTKPPESGHFKSDYQQLYSTGGVPNAAPVQCSPLNFNRPFNNSNYTPLGLEYGNLNLYTWLNQMYTFPGGGHQSPSEHFHSGLLKRATEDLNPSGLHPNIKDPDGFDDNDNNGIRGSVHEREDGSDPLDQSWSGSASPTSRVSLKKKFKSYLNTFLIGPKIPDCCSKMADVGRPAKESTLDTLYDKLTLTLLFY